MSIRLAVVGLGYASQTFHLPIVQTLPTLTISACVSSQTDKAANLLPSADCYLNLNSLLENADIDAVIIASPNALHYSQVKQCLLFGKHVLVEKPFCVTVEQAEELCTLASQKNLILMAYQNRRWDGDFLTVKQLLSKHTLGELKIFESRFDRFRPNVRDRWRERAGDGTGILYDLGSHLIDQILSLFGMPNAVSARCPTLREGGDSCDYFHIQLVYPTHEVILNSSPFSAISNRRFYLQGTLGSYEKLGLDNQEPTLQQGLTPDSPDWSDAINEPEGLIADAAGSRAFPTQSGCYQTIYQQFADAILSGDEVEISLQQMKDVIRLIQLCQRSHECGQVIVL